MFDVIEVITEHAYLPRYTSDASLVVRCSVSTGTEEDPRLALPCLQNDLPGLEYLLPDLSTPQVLLISGCSW